MPIRIPTYISKTAPVVVDRGGVSPESTGGLVVQGLESVSKVLAGIQLDTEKRVGDAARMAELVDRNGRFTDRIGQLQEELAQDTDHNTYFDRAKKGIEQAVAETLEGVRDPDLKYELTRRIAGEKDRHLLDARHQALKLKIDYSSAVGEENLERQVLRGLEATDARDLMAAEREIDGTVVGLVKGGVRSAERGERNRRASHGKLETALAERLADQDPGRFLKNYEEGVYKDSHIDPLRLETVRRFAANRFKGAAADAGAEEIWERLGPKADLEPVNLDRMEKEVSGLFAEDPERARLARATLREKASAHDKGVAERREANLSAIFGASLPVAQGGKGYGVARVVAMREYSALDGKSKAAVMKQLEADATGSPESTTQLRNWGSLARNPKALREARLDNLLVSGQIHKSRYDDLVRDQAELLGATGKEKEFRIQTNAEVVKNVLERAGFAEKDEPEAHDRFYDRLYKIINAKYPTGKPPTQEQLQAEARGLVGKVAKDGWLTIGNARRSIGFGTTQVGFDVTYESIPKKQREQIEGNLQRKTGGKYTHDDVVNAFLAAEQKKQEGSGK